MSRDDRLELVEYLHFEKGLKQKAIAKILHCHYNTTLQDFRCVRARMASRVDTVHIKEVAGQLLQWADVLTARAIQRNDPKSDALAWKIQVDLVEKLQDLGIIYRAPTELTGVVTIQEVMSLAIGTRQTINVPSN